MKKCLIIFCVALFATSLYAQAQPPIAEIAMPKVPAMRLLHHDYIDNNQKLIAKLDGVDDGQFIVTSNDSINKLINQALFVIVNNMQAKIELNKSIDENSRYKWLRGLNDMLVAFISKYKVRNIKGQLLYEVITSYQDAMELDWKNESIKPILERNELEVDDILIQNYCLKTNAGIAQAKDALLLKQCKRYPKKTMSIIAANPQAYFVDSIINYLAVKDPEKVYNYAAAPDSLGKKIQSSTNPLVKQIGVLALMKSGRMLFPFLDNLYRGKITMDSITKALEDTTTYFKLLVNTQIEYAARMQQNDTPIVAKAITSKLKYKANEHYIREINRLHEAKQDKVRFASLDLLSAKDLYYVAVINEEEIYTSSYLGVYKRIFEKMKTPNADTLLNWVSYDKYKKFLKIAANYNTLDDFLSKMDKANAEKIMRNFVSGLENNQTLEDAVDVANSYASIYNPSLKKLILNQIQTNLTNSTAQANENGETIYNLLNIIFLSLNSTSIDLPTQLGIEGVYNMPIQRLKDSSGKIIIQQFFYGDKDGQGVFNSFFRNYSPAFWKKTEKPSWVELSSIKGVPITIYSNRALDNEKNLDSKAQRELGRYLEQNNLQPTFVIHRGHSYFVDSTIEQLPESAKIVLLGSCGGYQRLTDVIDYCNTPPHIIATKQTGIGVANIALIVAITEDLRAGKNLDWPSIWKKVGAKFKGEDKEKFDDYVPPYKNLGAIFITAYKLAMQKE